MWMDHILVIHPSVDGHLGFAPFLTVVTSAAVNTRVHVLQWTDAFISVGSVPRSGGVGSSVTPRELNFLGTVTLLSIASTWLLSGGGDLMPLNLGLLLCHMGTIQVPASLGCGAGGIKQWQQRPRAASRAACRALNKC